MAKGKEYNVSLGFAGPLALVLIVLKLTGQIGWAWWWVLTPLWAPLAAAFAIITVLVLVVTLVKTVYWCARLVRGR